MSIGLDTLMQIKDCFRTKIVIDECYLVNICFRSEENELHEFFDSDMLYAQKLLPA